MPAIGNSISAPVGRNGANKTADVATVQSLLNAVGPESGGASPKLAVDGLCGPRTIAAIRAFQQSQFGSSDGVVSPGQRTILRLNELAIAVDGGVPSAELVGFGHAILAQLRRLPLFDMGAASLALGGPAQKLENVLRELGGASDGRIASLGFAAAVPAPIVFGGAGVGAVLNGVFLPIAVVALILHNRPLVEPKTPEEVELEKQLSALELLATNLSIEKARDVSNQVRKKSGKLEECGLRNLVQIAPGGKCHELSELFKKAKQSLLQKLTQYQANPFRFPGLVKAINEALQAFEEAFKRLNDCLDCKLNEPPVQ